MTEQNKAIKKILEFYFIIVATLMYYFLTEIINLGLFVTYRHALALVLAGSAFLLFLIKPHIPRGFVAIKASFAYSLPLLITIVVSLFIWFIERVDTSVISRGLSGAFVYNNMLSFSLCGAAFLYIFGEKGIWYNLVAILCANILMLITIILKNGIVPFFSELITLIVTFAGKTGDIIVQAEIHELAFCLGAYLIYMFLKPKKNIAFLILLGLTLFCFLAAFKRIGIIAIVVALFFGWLLLAISKLKKDTAYSLTIGLSVLLIVILTGYIALIKAGAFELIEKAGIDTSGRVVIYNAVDKFYEFSPEFLGNGIGFLTYQLSSNMNVGVSSVHNDFLQYFIDLGFFGYLLWLTSMTLTRIIYFGKKGKIENAIITFALMVYLVIISSTDNTMNYPLLTTVLLVIMAGHGYDEEVKTAELKLFGLIKKGDNII